MFTFWRFWSPRRSNWTHFSSTFTISDGNILDIFLILKSLYNIFPFNFIDFLISILINKVIDMHETTTNSDEDLISFFDFNVNSFLAELINTFGLSEEHDLHFIPFRIPINIISKSFINWVIFLSNINCLILFKHFNYVHELLNSFLWKVYFLF